MADAAGRVFFTDGTVMWFQYSGASDSCQPALYGVFEDMWEKFDESSPIVTITPKMQAIAEPVIIEAFYGGGFWWSGKAVRFAGKDQICGYLTEGTMPFDPYEESGSTTDGLYQPIPEGYSKNFLIMTDKWEVTGTGNVIKDLELC